MAECAAAFPEPYLLTETENKIIDDMLELLNKHGLTSHQSRNLLDRLGKSVRWGSEWRRGHAFTRRALMGSMTTDETQS